MKKRHIISALVVLVMLAGIGAVYQFYFKKQLERYAENKQLLTDLERRLAQLEETFSGVRPDYVLQQWRGAVQPWADAVNVRAQYFTMDDLSSAEPIPEGELPRFYYEKKFPQMVNELLMDSYQRGCIIPSNITFGAPDVSSLANRSVSKEEVELWLSQMALGGGLLRMAMAWNPIQIRDMQMWPSRVEYDLLEMQTVGFDFTITLENLVDLLESCSRATRYFNVNGIQIHNGQLRTYYPVLDVKMLVTRAQFRQEERQAAGASEGEAAGTVDAGKILSDIKKVRSRQVRKREERPSGRLSASEREDLEEQRRDRWNFRRFFRRFIPI